MGFDSISNAPLPALNNKDFSKKKRTNRLAKLKQSKLDVRREQWLSQVKNKGCKMDSIGKGESPQSPIETVGKQKSLDGLESRPREEAGSSSIQDSDVESVMSSPIGSILDHSDSSKGHAGSSGNSSSSSTSSGYCSGSVSEEEEEDDDDGCLDNWETIADALSAKENNELIPVPNPTPEPENSVALADPIISNSNTEPDSPKTEVVGGSGGSDVNRRRAWRSDDTFRPQSLPNLLKQRSCGTNSDRQCSSHGAMNRAWQTVMSKSQSQPSSCPICCEDLDVTDTSFLPCSCGFRLCLFCHKRILEADGRCPGCRKHYDPLSGNTGLSHFRMVRSFSMSTRS